MCIVKVDRKLAVGILRNSVLCVLVLCPLCVPELNGRNKGTNKKYILIRNNVIGKD
jgi:hypothetical protein